MIETTKQPVKQPTLNVKQTAKRRSKAKDSTVEMRSMLWPDLDESKLWLRQTNDGYTTLPRTMPLIMNLINDLSKSVNSGKSAPAGKAYLVLWCRVFDEAMVKIDNEAAAAVEAGYIGERNTTTWREHLRVLKDLGFIDYKPGTSGPCHYILIYNPYHVIKAHRKDIQEATYITLYQRALEIGATKDIR